MIRPTSDESQSGFDRSGPSGGAVIGPVPGGTYDGGDVVGSVSCGAYDGGGDAIAIVARDRQPKTNRNFIISLTPHPQLLLKTYNGCVFSLLLQ